MAQTDSLIGPALTLAEVKKLVEAASTAFRLEFDDVKGRYLVARRPLKPGDVVLSEFPIFRGCSKGHQSKKAYVEDFVALAATSAEDGDEEFGDCLHPLSPLVDCVADILLEKQRAQSAESKADMARAKLRLRQLCSLSRASIAESVPEGCAEDIFGRLRPELRALTSEAEVGCFLHALSSNRFATADSRLDVMFAGSMFEHSCSPNCFLGCWQAVDANSSGYSARKYRACRDIAEGEALSIDYLWLPGSYLSAAQRAEALSRWGFSCTCPRCVSLPEVTRAFACPACNAPELCPIRPCRNEDEDVELRCLSCGVVAEATYAARCLAREGMVRRRKSSRLPDVAELPVEEAEDGKGLLSIFHYASFEAAWEVVLAGPSEGPDELDMFEAAVEALIDCIARLYDEPRHPQLLDLYHTMAELKQGDHEEQREYLDLEHAVIQHNFPDESERQDAEIMALVTGRGKWSIPEAPGPLSDMD
eukprot:gnl/TRDRNA2_/TRDRNA2_168444_c4_seq1.p1 gnl/TRDRNA2_/TRDRNA2_168444_c4~~gnl/TRDRNA2_/TRDRNA2_168444_c4_seq1.p1  ORF type:complete len:477 (+),score=89.68 gnl/TRDRNA2_/TRDRNA2_168444_c4_seq1:110-1540(+)